MMKRSGDEELEGCPGGSRAKLDINQEEPIGIQEEIVGQESDTNQWKTKMEPYEPLLADARREYAERMAQEGEASGDDQSGTLSHNTWWIPVREIYSSTPTRSSTTHLTTW